VPRRQGRRDAGVGHHRQCGALRRAHFRYDHPPTPVLRVRQQRDRVLPDPPTMTLRRRYRAPTAARRPSSRHASRAAQCTRWLTVARVTPPWARWGASSTIAVAFPWIS
jgi:hypothetical protein